MTLIVAHRGGKKSRESWDCPASSHRNDIRRATRYADMLHLPVRLTRDQVPVVWHDKSVTIGKSWQSVCCVNACTLPDAVLTLDEAPALDAKLLLEPKDQRTAAYLLEHPAEECFAYISARRGIQKLFAAYQAEQREPRLRFGAIVDMQAIRESNPDLLQQQKGEGDYLGDQLRLRHALDAVPLASRSVLLVNYDLLSDASLVRMAAEASRLLGVLTVDDVAEALSFKKMQQVRAVVTNYPQRMRRAWERSL